MARRDEAKWKRIVASVKAGSKGGRPGQWSARKAQLATQRYKKSGGTYSGPKTKAQKSLSKWTKEDYISMFYFTLIIVMWYFIFFG